MTDQPPTPPIAPPSELVDSLDACSSEQLRQIAAYAEELAAFRDRDQAAQTDDDPEREDRPDGVPGKATITIKEINDNRYYYWQWRDGDTIRSQYKGPVNPYR